MVAASDAIRRANMKVDVSGQKFVFPQTCACCGSWPHTTFAAVASKTTGSRVVRTQSKSWDFPYCGSCICHVSKARTATNVSGTIAALAVVAAVVAGFSGLLAISVVVAAAGISGAIYSYHKLMGQARALCSPNCASVECAVKYLG